jgi:quinol monooxygenase YgiN
MIVAVGDVYVQIPRAEEARELMRATQARAREQHGCDYYVFAETLDDPGHFLVVQQWRDQEALDEHYASAAFADYQRQIGPLLVRVSELRVHQVGATARPVDSSPIEISQDD